jgi:hypothetical protein
VTDEIRSLADLRPGDLMFGPIGGLVPGLFPVGFGQALLGEVFRAGKLSVRHVGVVIEPGTPNQWAARPDMLARGPMLVQAMPSGAEEIELTDMHWTDRYAYARLPEDYPGQAEDAAAIARLFVDEQVPYSFASYAALAAWRVGFKAERLARWIDRRGREIQLSTWTDRMAGMPAQRIHLPAEAICSVLADQAWTLTGKHVIGGTRSQIVTPGMLATQLWRRPGVVWGGPGLL